MSTMRDTHEEDCVRANSFACPTRGEDGLRSLMLKGSLCHALTAALLTVVYLLCRHAPVAVAAPAAYLMFAFLVRLPRVLSPPEIPRVGGIRQHAGSPDEV